MHRSCRQRLPAALTWKEVEWLGEPKQRAVLGSLSNQGLRIPSQAPHWLSVSLPGLEAKGMGEKTTCIGDFQPFKKHRMLSALLLTP